MREACKFKMSASTAPSSLSYSLPFLLYANNWRDDLQGISVDGRRPWLSCVPCRRHQLADAPRLVRFHGNPPPFPPHCPLAGSPSVLCSPLYRSLTPIPLYKTTKGSEASLTATSPSLSPPPPQRQEEVQSESVILLGVLTTQVWLRDVLVYFKRFWWWVSFALLLLGSIDDPLFCWPVHVCKFLCIYATFATA